MKKQAIVVGSMVQRRDLLPFTRRGVVLEIIAPRGTFDTVTRAKVRWGDSTGLVELWPVAFLIIADQEAEDA